MLIGSKYKIESDNLNVTLYESAKNKKTGVQRWNPIAYFSTVKQTLKYLVDREVAETGLKDFKIVVEKQNELYDLIKHLQIPELMSSRL